MLTAPRVFVDGAADAAAAARGARDRFAAGDGEPLAYDPRFLVFEFTWNLVLRSRQVALVRDILEATARGLGACVKQMRWAAARRRSSRRCSASCSATARGSCCRSCRPRCSSSRAA